MFSVLFCILAYPDADLDPSSGTMSFFEFLFYCCLFLAGGIIYELKVKLDKNEHEKCDLKDKLDNALQNVHQQNEIIKDLRQSNDLQD